MVIYKKANKLALINDVLETDSGSQIIENVKGLIRKCWDSSPVVRDSRWPFVDKSDDGLFIPRGFHAGQSYHGYSSAPLDAFLNINCFDENLDGDNALLDVDAGIRSVCRYKDRFILDKNIWIFENMHHEIPEDLLTYKGPTIRQ